MPEEKGEMPVLQYRHPDVSSSHTGQYRYEDRLACIIMAGIVLAIIVFASLNFTFPGIWD